jgi:hypothetical protein
VKLDVRTHETRSLLDAASPATLTLYREDGEAITSPVWFRVADEAFEVVVAASDHKLGHLRRDPRCVLLKSAAAAASLDRASAPRSRARLEPR